MTRVRTAGLWATVFFLIGTASCFADARLPLIFGDDMVLQRQMPVPVWGWANAGEAVTVTFAGQTKKVVAGGDGKWQTVLDPMPASAEGRDLIVGDAASPRRITLHDVLVGEVWLCSGQSNMEWGVGMQPDGKAIIAAAEHPSIRLFVVAHGFSYQPKDRPAQGRRRFSAQSPRQGRPPARPTRAREERRDLASLHAGEHRPRRLEGLFRRRVFLRRRSPGKAPRPGRTHSSLVRRLELEVLRAAGGVRAGAFAEGNRRRLPAVRPAPPASGGLVSHRHVQRHDSPARAVRHPRSACGTRGSRMLAVRRTACPTSRG